MDCKKQIAKHIFFAIYIFCNICFARYVSPYIFCKIYFLHYIFLAIYLLLVQPSYPLPQGTARAPQASPLGCISSPLGPDCLIAKVDYLGFLEKIYHPHLYIFLYIFAYFHRVMGGGRLRRPPLINYQFRIKNKTKNMQIYV